MDAINPTTRVTVLCIVVAGAYTCFAYLCGAGLPPLEYVFCAAVVSVQAILCYNSSSIIRWVGGGDTLQAGPRVIVKVIFNLIISIGSAYGMLAKLRIQDGIPVNGPEGILRLIVISVELGLGVFPNFCESGLDPSSRRSVLMAGRA